MAKSGASNVEPAPVSELAEPLGGHAGSPLVTVVAAGADAWVAGLELLLELLLLPQAAITDTKSTTVMVLMNRIRSFT